MRQKTVVSVLTFFAFNIPLSFACTSIIVGKNAASNSKILLARTSDTTDARRAKNLQFYLDASGQRSYTGLPYADLQDDANADMPQVTTNRYGVSLSATETIQSNPKILELDPFSLHSGVFEPNIPSIVMPNAHSAKEAITILGQAIESRGVRGLKGFGVLVADAHEAWYLETLSGHQWVAILIPEDMYFAATNGPGQIQEYDPAKYSYLLSNYKGLSPIIYAEKNSISKYSKNFFDFRKTYGDINNAKNSLMNFVRLAYVQHYFNPHTAPFDTETMQKGEYPMFLKPEQPISLEDIKQVQQTHYENFPDFDPYIRNARDNNFPYFAPISKVNTSNAHITEIGRPLNENDYSLSNVDYICLGMPAVSFYLPLYAGVTHLFPELTGASNEADNKTLFWQLRKIQVLAFFDDPAQDIAFAFNERAHYIQAKYKEFTAKVGEKQKALEQHYQHTKDSRLIDAFTETVIAELWQLNEEIIDYFMQQLDVDKKYSLFSEEKRNEWFTKILYQQDCSYREKHCANVVIPEKIKKKFDATLYKMKPLVQSHYAVRLYRMTGDKEYLNPIINFQFIESMQLNKLLLKAKTTPVYFSANAINLPKNHTVLSKKERRLLLLKQFPGISNLLKMLLILDHAQQLNLLQTPLYSHSQLALAKLRKEMRPLQSFLLDPTVIRTASAQIVGFVYILKRLELADITEKYNAEFQKVFPDYNDKNLNNEQFMDKIYGMTHLIFSESAYYQNKVSYDRFKWIYTYFDSHIDEIISRTKLDVIVEVGICYYLASAYSNLAVTQKIVQYLESQFDPESQMMHAKKGISDYLDIAEHRNVLSLMFLNWPEHLHAGPDLSNSPMLLNALEPIHPL